MLYGLGIDVSMKKIDVCIGKIGDNQSMKVLGTRKFINSLSGFKKLDAWIKSKAKGENIHQIVLEPTGVYHENLTYYLSDNNYNICVVMAKQAKYYLMSLGNKSKTDKIDARGLCQMACERKLEVWEAPSKEVRDLRSVCRLKDSLNKDKNMVSNRLHAMKNSYSPDKYVIKELKYHLASIEKRLTKLTYEIEMRLSTDNKFNNKVRKIAKSINGVGEQTVATVASELLGFAFFSSQSQLTSYCGYDVKIAQSGQHAGKEKISKQGNSRVRKALHFPALGVVRHEKDKKGIFNNLNNRVYARTKIKMKGYVAIQRKLLMVIFTLWKNDSTFDPNYENAHPKFQQTISGIEEQEPSFSH